VQQSEDYVLRILEEVGLVTRRQIDSARSRLNGAASVIDVLINDGIVSDADVSRALAAQAHMDWIDISSMVIPHGHQANSRRRSAPVQSDPCGVW
jgi:hypothetical protein